MRGLAQDVQRSRLEAAWLALVASVVVWSDPGAAHVEAPLLAAARPPPIAPSRSARSAARAAGCALFADRARTLTSAECLACHGRGRLAELPRACHPVGIDYARASQQRAALRPLAEVLRRGVLLPDHELRCVTCHDARSPWAHAVALPPGSAAVRAVDREHPLAYGVDPAPASLGDPVDARPLCVACHLVL